MQPEQPILITAHTGTHHDVLTAVARASAATFQQWLHQNPEHRETTADLWTAWLATGTRKTVRHTSAAKLAAAMDLPNATAYTYRGVTAIAFPPIPRDDFDRVIRRAQVAGTDWADKPEPVCILPTGRPCVAVDASLGMSTGKAAAQVAHGAVGVVEEDPDVDVDTIDVVWADHGLVEKLAAVAPVVVHDAGHTELEPDTLTVVAVLAG